MTPGMRYGSCLGKSVSGCGIGTLDPGGVTHPDFIRLPVWLGTGRGLPKKYTKGKNMNTSSIFRKPAVFQIAAAAVLLLALGLSLAGQTVSADSSLALTKGTSTPGRTSEYWIGRGQVVEEPGIPGNHVMMLKQQFDDDFFEVVLKDRIPVQGGEDFELSWKARGIRRDLSSEPSWACFVLDVYDHDLLIQRVQVILELEDGWHTYGYTYPMEPNATHVNIQLVPDVYDLEDPGIPTGSVPVKTVEVHAVRAAGGPENPANSAEGGLVIPAPASLQLGDGQPPYTILFDDIILRGVGSPLSLVPDWNFENLISPVEIE